MSAAITSLQLASINLPIVYLQSLPHMCTHKGWVTELLKSCSISQTKCFSPVLFPQVILMSRFLPSCGLERKGSRSRTGQLCAALREDTTWREVGAGEEVTRAGVGRAYICVLFPRPGTEAAHRQLSSLVETGFISDCLWGSKPKLAKLKHVYQHCLEPLVDAYSSRTFQWPSLPLYSWLEKGWRLRLGLLPIVIDILRHPPIPPSLRPSSPCPLRYTLCTLFNL